MISTHVWVVRVDRVAKNFLGPGSAGTTPKKRAPSRQRALAAGFAVRAFFARVRTRFSYNFFTTQTTQTTQTEHRNSSVPVCKYRPNSMPGRSKERRERLGSFQARSPLLYRQFPASGFWSAIATRDTRASARLGRPRFAPHPGLPRSCIPATDYAPALSPRLPLASQQAHGQTWRFRTCQLIKLRLPGEATRTGRKV